MTGEAQLARRLQALMDGCLTTQVLYAASALGVLDTLASRPHTAAELAEAVGVAEGPLRRIPRFCSAASVYRMITPPSPELGRDVGLACWTIPHAST